MPVFSLMIFLLMSLLMMAMNQIQFFEVAFAKLGLTPGATLLVLIGTLVGSGASICRFSNSGPRRLDIS